MIIDLDIDSSYYPVSQHRCIESYDLRNSPFAVKSYKKTILAMSLHVFYLTEDKRLFFITDPLDQSTYYFQCNNGYIVNLDKDLRLIRKYNK